MRVACIRSLWKVFEVGQVYDTTSTYSSPYKGKDYWYHTFEHTGQVGFRAENFAIIDAEPTTITEEETLLQTA